MKKDKIILIGIGNTLRTDDGVGAYVIAQIYSNENIPFSSMIVQQLTSDLIPSLLSYDQVLIIDAELGINTVRWQTVKDGYAGTTPFVHSLDISQFLSLARTLYNASLVITVCTIPVFDLRIGEGLSAETRSLTDLAVKQIEDWLKTISS